jgi:hypothetical protein
VTSWQVFISLAFTQLLKEPHTVYASTVFMAVLSPAIRLYHKPFEYIPIVKQLFLSSLFKRYFCSVKEK